MLILWRHRKKQDNQMQQAPESIIVYECITWIGCNPRLQLPNPSTVITCIPSTEYRGAKQALIAQCLEEDFHNKLASDVKKKEGNTLQVEEAKSTQQEKKHLHTFPQLSFIMRNHNCASSTTAFTTTKFSPRQPNIYYTRKGK